MLSLAALHAERSSALIFLVSRSTQSIIYYAKRYSGWQYWVQHCSRVYCNGFSFWWVPPRPKPILGIPFQKNAFRSFCLKGEVLAAHCFSSYRAAFTHTQRETLFPLCSCPSLPLCCAADPARSFSAEKQPAWCRLFHSLLVEWFNKFTLGGTFFFFLSTFTGQCACVVRKTIVLQQNSEGFHHWKKPIFCKQVFLTALYAKRRSWGRGKSVLGSL